MQKNEETKKIKHLQNMVKQQDKEEEENLKTIITDKKTLHLFGDNTDSDTSIGDDYLKF
jgi:hypothetical protein